MCRGESPSELTRGIAELAGALKDAQAALLETESRLRLALEAAAERQRAEMALRESGERTRLLASIVESSIDAIVTKDLDGTITSWNKGAEAIFGYSAEDVIGKPVTILIPTERLDEEPMILERIRRGDRIQHYETVRRRKDGILIDISLTVSPLRSLDGVIVGASKIAREITERKRAEDLMTTLAREAEHRAKNVLATVAATVNLSHGDTVDELKRAIEGRIRALSDVHSLFVQSRWAGADVAAILALELEPYQQEKGKRAVLDGPHVIIEPAAAQALAVVVHELATNAAKYGALSAPAGNVLVNWSGTSQAEIQLRWTETGGPTVNPPFREGFGTKVMQRMIDAQGGTLETEWNPRGLICAISLPTKRAQGP